MLKKQILGSISSSDIDRWYELAMKNGATGGKVLGAGSGGFLMFYAPKEKHEAIKNALPNLKEIDFKYESQGSQIIFVH
jgi:D-glycero-alpha-D-manno-heptose-7-phosphate kinase